MMQNRTRHRSAENIVGNSRPPVDVSLRAPESFHPDLARSNSNGYTKNRKQPRHSVPAIILSPPIEASEEVPVFTPTKLPDRHLTKQKSLPSDQVCGRGGGAVTLIPTLIQRLLAFYALIVLNVQSNWVWVHWGELGCGYVDSSYSAFAMVFSQMSRIHSEHPSHTSFSVLFRFVLSYKLQADCNSINNPYISICY